jgi:hypothetical protein
MNKQNVVYPFHQIVFSLKKKGNSDTCYIWIKLKDIKVSELSQSSKGKYCMIPLI